VSAAPAGWLDDVVHWLRECSGRFAHAAAQTRGVAGGVERCWADERGREWVERAGLVQRQLEADAQACAELADRITRAAATEPQAAESAEATTGPLLGSTAARRVDGARGMRIATLPGDEPRQGP
jgi:hypothetical protein